MIAWTKSLRTLHVTILPPPQLHGDSHGTPKWHMTHLHLVKIKGRFASSPDLAILILLRVLRRMHPNSTFAVFLGEYLARRKLLQPRIACPGFWSQLCLFWRIEHRASRLASRSSSFDIRRARVWTLIYKVPVRTNRCFSLPHDPKCSPLLSSAKLISALLLLLDEATHSVSGSPKVMCSSSSSLSCHSSTAKQLRCSRSTGHAYGD